MTTLKEALKLLSINYKNQSSNSVIWIDGESCMIKDLTKKYDFSVDVKSIEAKFICHEYEGFNIITNANTRRIMR